MTELHTISFKCCDWCINLLNYSPPKGVIIGDLRCKNNECCFFEQDHYSILETFSKIGIYGAGTYRARQDRSRINAGHEENSRKFSEILVGGVTHGYRIRETKVDSSGNEYFEVKL